MCLTTYLPFCANIHANQETKGDISCTPPPPQHQMPTSRRVERAITPAERNETSAAGERSQNWSVSSFWDIVCLFYPFHSWLGVVLCDERREWTGGILLPPPSFHNAHLNEKKLRVLPEGTPGLSQHQLHICSLVADTRMTPADPRMKTLIKNLSPPIAYSLLPTDCTWAINPLSTKWNFCLNEAIMSSSSQTAESNEDPDYSFHGLCCGEDR